MCQILKKNFHLERRRSKLKNIPPNKIFKDKNLKKLKEIVKNNNFLENVIGLSKIPHQEKNF